MKDDLYKTGRKEKLTAWSRVITEKMAVA